MTRSHCMHASVAYMLEVSVTCLCETCKMHASSVTMYLRPFGPLRARVWRLGPRSPLRFCFCFPPPPRPAQVAGPDTRREIKNASPWARDTREGIALSGTPLLGRRPSREYSSGSQSCCGGGGAVSAPPTQSCRVECVSPAGRDCVASPSGAVGECGVCMGLTGLQ